MFNKAKIEALERRIVQLENPFKYNVGDVVYYDGQCGVITIRHFEWIEDSFFTNKHMNKTYMVYFSKTKKTIDCMEHSLTTKRNK